MKADNIIGHTIAGCRILKSLGEGGMGRLYLGERNGVRVVLKEHLDGDAQALLREAQFLANLKHPRLPRVLTFEQGYLVMEFVEGENFEEYIEKLKTTPGWNFQEGYLRQVVEWGLQMADVLHYLHNQRPYPVLHRDIKPSNIILRPDGQICLIDFGIARHFDREKLAQRIKDTCPAGTEGYMAPEFVMFKCSDPRCDIYSLGMVFHYWLSGEQPDPTGTKQLQRLKRTGDPLWDNLVEISEKCRHPEPTKRYQSASELAVELRKLSPSTAEHKPREIPCPVCQNNIRVSCRFCPSCGSPMVSGKAKKKSVSVQVRVEITSDSLGVLESIIQTAENHSGANLEHFQAYHKLLELEQDPGFGELISLDHLPFVEKLPHQIEAARKALSEMRGYCLLADEVGLGKTIEAGIILKELRLRGLAERILILAPRDLCSQWQQEMFEKFDEFFLVFGRDVDYSLGWQCNRVIAPYSIVEDRFHRQCILSQKYDLLIMDEAHHLIVEDPRRSWILHEFARALGARTTYFLMLSATPLHNDLKELHTLLTLLKPGSVGDFEQFKERYMDPNDPYKPKNVQELRQRLQSVMIRNTRRRIAELPFPRREAHRIAVELPGRALKVFADFRQFVRSELWTLAPDNAIFRRYLQLLVESFHSSPEAFTRSCDEFIRSFRRMVPARSLNSLRDFQSRMNLDCLREKVDQTANIVTRITQIPGNKVLIFTEYEDTADLLDQELRTKGLAVVRYPGEDIDDGGERAMRALSEFRRFASVMVCTQNAAEGLNLQFANYLVNFDLPWDPMKLEQRIGRIQRIGGRPKVYIYNLFLKGTIEEDILDMLEKKIDMFGETIGQVEEILGNLADEDTFDQILLDLFISEDRTSAARKVEDLVRRARDSTNSERLLAEIFGEATSESYSPTTEPKTQVPISTTCPSCNALLPLGARYCDSCGYLVNRNVEKEGEEISNYSILSKTQKLESSGHDLVVSFCNQSADSRWTTSGSVTLPVRDTAYCRNCGTRLSPGAMFCDQCGERNA